LEGHRLDIFNASSFCSNLLVQLAKSWHPYVKSKDDFKIPVHIRTYKHVIERIIHRRTNALRTDKGVFESYPLSPYGFKLTPKQLLCVKHLEKKFKNVHSLPVDAIIRSPISNHEMLTEFTGIIYPYKNIR
jgi:hypothetical protein